MSSHPEPQEHQSRHPTFKQYVLVASILFIITIFEFLIIVPDQFKGSGTVVAPLLILSALKFAIVIMFYMHLKFDAKLYTWIFGGGLLLGASVLIAMLFLFQSFRPEPRDFAEAFALPYAGHEGPGGPSAEAPIPGPGHPSSPGAPQQPPPGGAKPPEGSPAGPGGPPPGGGGQLVAQGQALFTGKGGCMACHTVEGVAAGMVGPDLTHIGTDAANRKPGMSARDYITESIRTPEAFVATGVERAIPGVMTSALTSSLSDNEVEALVEFLLAQK
jgi:cytochrome c oxidase subunit 4